ncbi:MAG: hypothetical protein LVT47_08750 [Cyanobacteria bacterium LVE1205-1]|jgi:hypothetical protein|nr:hypothetical protein [Cyanobacteria bacterium WB6_1B_304]
MTPLMLRQVWVVVEATQANLILKLDDASLVEWLLKKLALDYTLDHSETRVLGDYIQSRLSLIRDLAGQRLQGNSIIR